MLPPLRFRLLTAALGAAVLCLTAVGTARGAAERPNVVLVLTDDQGYGDLSLHGNPHLQTPNLDRIGREGVQLTRFHVMPVCSPTRACLMTGRYNYRTGVVDTFIGRSMMHPEERTMAEQLGAAGYRTGIFGKWHLGDNYPLRAIDQGFQEALTHNGGGLGQPSDPPGNRYHDPILQQNGRPRKFTGYCTDIFTDAAIRFIEKNRSRPFFAYLATNAPHDPLQIDEKYVAPFRAQGLDEHTAKVYGMVRNIDENVGRLLDRLAALKLEQKTLVVFMTDNGPQQQRYVAGMRGRKGTPYEGGIRVPCFLRWPGTLPAGKVDRIAAHIDLLPTILEACGVSAPEDVQFDGRSLLPLARGRLVEWPARTLFFQWHRGDQPEAFRGSAALTDRYKLVNGRELYDLPADPAESRDLASAEPGVVLRLRTAYLAWLQDVSGTRGYDPPRIQLGTRHENPVILTRQDWRGPRAGWASESLGYWEVQVTRKGPYSVTLRFPEQAGPGKATLRVGDVTVDRPVQQGGTSAAFYPVRLPTGPGRLEAWVRPDKSGEPQGVHYVDVSRADLRRPPSPDLPPGVTP